jgi:hypothetical protein
MKNEEWKMQNEVNGGFNAAAISKQFCAFFATIFLLAVLT